MVQSMTGFGSAERNGCRVEVRSINHRYLDIFMRVPPYLNQLDIPFRNLLKGYFSRGKIDVTITISEAVSAELTINYELVQKVITAFRQLQQELSIKGDIDVNTIVNLHDIFIETDKKYDTQSLIEIFKEAVQDLRAMRGREGQALAADILRMTDSLREMNDKIKIASRGFAAAAVERFKERLSILLQGREIDETRVLQEAAIIVARMDISEEVARIESHINQFREILAKGGIIGRKLDFILQELNREVNTIASKSAEYDLSSLTVEMKAEIEKIREQVQNIE